MARYHSVKTDKLRQWREQANLTQLQVAHYFGLSDRESIAAWEIGQSAPREVRRRAEIIGYLLDKLNLRRTPQEFFALWNEVMVEEWLWEPLSEKEIARHLPSFQGKKGVMATPLFLAPARPPYQVIGRAVFLRDVKQRLFNGQYVALYGLPGVGKTTLAITVAHDRDVIKHFQDGVLWAKLGRRADVLSELRRWGSALGITQEAVAERDKPSAWIEAIRSKIGTRRMLLIIDDAWKIEDAQTFVAGGLNCAYLVTTRIPEVAADFAIEGSVKLPELDQTNSKALLNSLAPQLDGHTSQTMQALLAAVGGLPLALTLIGKYLRRATFEKRRTDLDALLSTLQATENRLQLQEPQSPAQLHPSLQPDTVISLRAIISISVEALNEVAQTALGALAIIPPKPNTFSPQLALAVTGAPFAIIDTLTDVGIIEPSGVERYTLHQTIVDYARLFHPNATANQRFVAYCNAYAEQFKAAHDAIDLEWSNLLAALEVAGQQGLTTEFIQMAQAVYWFMENRGLYPQAETLLQQAAQIAKIAQRDTEYVQLLHGLITITMQRGNYAQAEKYLQESIALANVIGYGEPLITQVSALGKLAAARGLHDQAEENFQEALRLAQIAKEHGLAIAQLNNLGVMAIYRGQYAKADKYLQEGLALALKLGLRERACGIYSNLVLLTGETGAYDLGDSYVRAGVKLAGETNHRLLRALLLEAGGDLAEKRGRLTQAEDYYTEALTLYRLLEHREYMSKVLQGLGRLSCANSRYEQAETYTREGVELARTLQHPKLICEGLIGWSQIHLKQQCWTQALPTLEEALAIAQSLGMPTQIAYAQFGLGQVLLGQGKITEAQQYGEQSLVLLEEIGNSSTIEVKEWLNQLAKAER